MYERDLSRDEPEAFLDPENFVTGYDGAVNEKYRREQHTKGLDIGHRSIEVIISAYNVWHAKMRPRDGFSSDTLSSHETIGFHAGTAALLQGFLDSGCKITICRLSDDGITKTTIQGDDR